MLEKNSRAGSVVLSGPQQPEAVAQVEKGEADEWREPGEQRH